MTIRGLDKSSHIPLYRQLLSKLVRQIEAGELKVGERLPSEREMAEQLNVSRITARQAVDALVDSGLVYREQGRGTFVAEPKMRGLQGFTSFSEDLVARGFRPSSRVITQELVPADEKLQQQLKIGPEDQALHLVRVRMADEYPVAIQLTYLNHRLCPGIEHEDFGTHSLFTVLREKYYLHPAWTEVEMEALPATAEEAHLLEIVEGEPVLVVRGLTYTEAFEIIEDVRTVYRGKGLVLYLGRQRISTF
jgi:GntR family transcriptional regulator